MTYIGSKPRIPPKSRLQEWKAFEDEFRRRMTAEDTNFRDRRMFWMKALETQIRKIEQRPPNADRQKAINQMKEQLLKMIASEGR